MKPFAPRLFACTALAATALTFILLLMPDRSTPIIFTAIGPKSLEFAGTHCDGVLLHPFVSPQGVRNSARIVREAAEKAGRDPMAVRIYHNIIVAPDLPKDEEDAVVRGWMARALTAPRGARWCCDRCQAIHAKWDPICENCGGFDTLSWREPPETSGPSATGAELLPLLVKDRPAPAPEPEPTPQPAPEHWQHVREHLTRARALPRSYIDRLARHSHVLLMRTLSKFGLAGVRIGYMMGPKALIAEIDAKF